MNIYRTCSPSKLISKEQKHEMLKVTMSCGGGMAGTRWDEYIYSYDDESMPIDLQVDIPVYVKNYLDEEIMLNPRFIVKVEHISIVKVIEDITGWYNRGDGKQYLSTRYLRTKPYENVVLVNEYKFENNKDSLINTITTVRRD